MVCFYFLLAFKRGVSEGGERYFSVLPRLRSVYLQRALFWEVRLETPTESIIVVFCVRGTYLYLNVE
jgi:hypothetical protein